MRKIVLVFVIFFQICKAQNLPTKIVIEKITYQSGFFDQDEKIFKTEKKSISNKNVIKNFFDGFQNADNSKFLLTKFGIDTTFIKNNPEKILNIYFGRYKIDWNNEQKNFIFEKFRKIDNFKKVLNDYLDEGCCYSMHQFYRNKFVIKFYEKNKEIASYQSRKRNYGFIFPYKDKTGNVFYNSKIDALLFNVFNEKSSKELLENDKLLNNLVNRIVDNNINSLYKLSPYFYINEINELKTDFEIENFREVEGYGREVGSIPNTKFLEISLKSKEMLPNVSLVFIASIKKGKMYSRDSIKKDYKQIVEKVQSIDFIKRCLQKNPDLKLKIYYSDNKAINDYEAESLNKTPEEWKKHDDFLKNLDWDKKHGIKIEDEKKSVKVSERVDCGCNFRFEKTFLEKAIFLEFEDKTNASLWYLLPDESLVLYHGYLEDDSLEIQKANLTKDDVPFICLRYDKYGKLLKK